MQDTARVAPGFVFTRLVRELDVQMGDVSQTKAPHDAEKSESPRTTILMLTDSEQALWIGGSFARVDYPWPWVSFSTITLPANER